MVRKREKPEIEERILFEIVVDAYDEIERAMGWYCYLQERLDVPFKARCKQARSMSPLEPGSQVQVVGMAPEDDCMSEVFVLIKFGKSKLAVPLSQLECLSPDEETCQAVADWHYWIERGYEY